MTRSLCVKALRESISYESLSVGIIMNKAELIAIMATMTKASKADCKKALEAFVEAVSKSLKKGKPVVLTNFGTFMVFKRKKRMGVNPSTGKKMEIPAKNVPKFKPGKNLRVIVA